MKKNNSLINLFVTLVVSLLLITGSTSFASGTEALSYEEYSQVMWGGQLYDKWYKGLDIDLNNTHPSYPTSGKKQGANTWRCKECHGWDYKGKEGAYSQGSHFTGIKGIREYSGKQPAVIREILNNDYHAFKKIMSDEMLEALSFFVSYGQVDMDRYIDRATKKSKGDINNGARIYSSTCARCHGADGRKINFKSPERPEYLGTIANSNPWETLHKIRFGQPSTEMVNLLFLEISDQVDTLSYCQTLPVR